ncbi:hypothetical protein PT974_09148 [Cladobotryum mycophilum]|uniref:RING-type domain-containing protein n=1 Tax=Cladobotryum mycophilum TaxID=491253 RepID=A0ABR0SFE5_9HYPO
MDSMPMDYVMHGPPRLPPHGEPAVHGPPGGWMPQPHGQAQISPSTHWASHPVPVPQFYPLPRVPHPGQHPFQLGPNGGLPPPDPSLRGFPLPDPLGLSMHQRPWSHHTTSDLSFNLGPQVSGRSLPYQQPPSELGLAPPGTTSEPHPMPPRSLFPQPTDHSVNNMGQPLVPQFMVPPHHHFSSAPSHRPGHPSSSAIPRAPRAGIPPPVFTPHHHEALPLPAPSSDRRRSGHSRARRSMNARLAMADSTREGDEDSAHGLRNHGPGRLGHRTSQSLGYNPSEESSSRNMQVIRGMVSSNTKMVASRAALHSLQSVTIEALPENERTCVICYNDYGVQTPEGINEAPLRLPKCKHVFGDHCIKKWFEDSDSCPYCRDKLPSEPKHVINPARALMNMMRLRGSALPDDMYMRLMSSLPSEELAEVASRQPHAAERRSLPDDAADNQRRIRPRRDSSEGESPSEDGDGSPRLGSGPPSSAPIRIPSQRHSHWMGRPSSQRRAAHATLNQVGNAMPLRGTILLPLPVPRAVRSLSLSNSLMSTDSMQVRGTDALERRPTDETSSRAAVEVSAAHIGASVSAQQTVPPTLTDQNRNRPW